MKKTLTLDKYDNEGKEIEYTIVEETVEGYTSKVEGHTITNTIKEESTKTNPKKSSKIKVTDDEDKFSKTVPKTGDTTGIEKILGLFGLSVLVLFFIGKKLKK